MALKVLAATRKGLFTLAPSGSAGSGWRIERSDFLADNVSIVLPDARSGKIYAALDHGHFGVKLHRADSLGGAWTELPAPAYPPKPEDATDKDMWGNPLPWSTVRIWALETGALSEPGVLWCGTIPGGLFRSDDHGASWQMIETLWRHPKRIEWMGGGADLPGLHSICVDPRDAQTLRIAVSTGGVWTTRDAGATWSNDYTGMWQDHAPADQAENPNGQDAHRLVQCPAAPDRLWVQHHNGIFRADDGGARWHECKDVTPSSFGFAVAVHPKDGDTAWFVPEIKDEKRIPADGRFVVTRTRDGGKSFDVLSKGLPEVPAYDIVYRHGLDISASGNDLVMGSTTGGLWVSRDQGDTWSAADVRLPPVYAVRFIEA
ncbi:MAG: WD40/YVTN/BNR-like repeat-containing protein [Hyphomicrobium sp.]